MFSATPRNYLKRPVLPIISVLESEEYDQCQWLVSIQYFIILLQLQSNYSCYSLFHDSASIKNQLFGRWSGSISVCVDVKLLLFCSVSVNCQLNMPLVKLASSFTGEWKLMYPTIVLQRLYLCQSVDHYDEKLLTNTCRQEADWACAITALHLLFGCNQ